jgi:type II secretion system protein H
MDSRSETAAPARSRLCVPRAGFTLMELLIVIVLIGVVAGMAIPRFDGWIGVTRLDSTASEFMSDVSFARMAAVQSGVRTRLVVDPPNRRYEILRLEADGTWLRIKTAPWHETVQTFGPAATLEFDSRGLLLSGGGIFTAEHHGRTRSVQVLPTGRAYRL